MGLSKYKVMEGKNPKTEQSIFYAMLAPTEPVKLAQLADVIAHECTLTSHDIRAVISEVETRLIEHICSGESVRFKLLGSFCPTLRCKAVDDLQDWSTSNIERIGVRFTPSAMMKYALQASNPANSFVRVQ